MNFIDRHFEAILWFTGIWTAMAIVAVLMFQEAEHRHELKTMQLQNSSHNN